MPNPLVPIAPIAGFGLVAVLLSVLNERRPVDVAGFLPVDGRNDWPQGVQEPDVQPFAVEHAAWLRGSAASCAEDQTTAAMICRPERVSSRVQRFAPDRSP